MNSSNVKRRFLLYKKNGEKLAISIPDHHCHKEVFLTQFIIFLHQPHLQRQHLFGVLMLGLNWKSKPPDSDIRREMVNFNESGNETVLISSCASYPKVMIMIIRGVSSLDVLILVNLEYLGSNALNKHYLVCR
jgi:hypothetical protein